MLYCRVLFLYLWPQLAQRAIISFLRCQGIVRPVTVITGVASALNVPVTAFLITTFGFIGAPFAQVFSGWLQLTALVIACKWRGYHHRCWGGWSKEALTDWGPMLKLGAAGTITMMGEWWSWEIASGMAATLGEVSLAAHACLSNIVRRQPCSCRPASVESLAAELRDAAGDVLFCLPVRSIDGDQHPRRQPPGCAPFPQFCRPRTSMQAVARFNPQQLHFHSHSLHKAALGEVSRNSC